MAGLNLANILAELIHGKAPAQVANDPQPPANQTMPANDDKQKKKFRPRIAPPAPQGSFDLQPDDVSQTRPIPDRTNPGAYLYPDDIPPQLPAGAGGLQPKVPTATALEPSDSVRPRVAGDPLAFKIANREKWINDPSLKNAPENKPNRFKAGLGVALANISEAIRAGVPWKEALIHGTGGMGAGMINPKMYADMENNKELGALRGQQDRNIKTRKSEMDLLTDQTELQGKIFDNQGKAVGNKQKVLDLVRSANKPLYESVIADGQIDADEAALLGQQGYPVVPYDARKMDRDRVNGVLYEQPQLGAGNKPQPVMGAPIDSSQTLKTYTLPSGNKVQISQNKVAEIEMTIAQGDAQRAMQMVMENTRIENQNIKEANESGEKRAAAMSESDGFLSLYELSRTQIGNLQTELQRLQANPDADPETIKAIRSQIAGAEKTRDEAIARSITAQKKADTAPAPKKQKPVTGVPRMTRVPQTDEATFRKRAQGKGISGEALERAVQKAREDNVIK